MQFEKVVEFHQIWIKGKNFDLINQTERKMYASPMLFFLCNAHT